MNHRSRDVKISIFSNRKRFEIVRNSPIDVGIDIDVANWMFNVLYYDLKMSFLFSIDLQ